MRDLATGSDIELLVNSFYDLVQKDELLAPVFIEIAAVDWIDHLPKMYQFWETLLLDKIGYLGSPVAEHVRLSKITPMIKYHFDRWLDLWFTTVESNFSGPLADKARDRADYMAMLMQYKINAA